MIDLLLWFNQASQFFGWCVGRGLLIQDEPGQFRNSEGFTWCQWAGSGKVMTSAPVLDGNGDVVTPAGFLTGFVYLCRIHGAFRGEDRLEGEPGTPQWERSALAADFRNNGNQQATGPFTGYRIANARLLDFDQLRSWLHGEGLPGHEWIGGNAP